MTLLTEYWRRKIVKSNELPPDHPRRLAGVFVPPDEFSAMAEEHNTVREMHGHARVRERDAREIRILGVIVKRLELLPARGRKETPEDVARRRVREAAEMQGAWVFNGNTFNGG
jgi:hypothetical protein